MQTRCVLPGVLLSSLLLAAPAPSAAVAPDRAGVASGRFEVYEGPPVRRMRSTANAAPARSATASAWRHFVAADPGGTWDGLWDLDTGVPLRIHGSGLAAPGAVAVAAAADAHARRFLAEHVGLLAPGAAPADFALVSNQLAHGVRTVGFRQSSAGLEVLGGQVSFRFRNDRLVVIASEALPHVEVRMHKSVVAAQQAQTAAIEWIGADIDPARLQAGSASAPLILPLVAPAARGIAPTYRMVRRVRVDTREPLGSWDVYVDAGSGAPVARRQRLSSGAGTLRYNAPERWAGGVRFDYPASYATLTVAGSAATTDQTGGFAWLGTDTVPLSHHTSGPLVAVGNAAGAALVRDTNAADGQQLVLDASGNEFEDAQVTAFVHANLAKDFVRAWNPDLAWLDQVLPVTVNMNSTCNAYSDGDALFFFREGGGCSNTAQLPDVVYHEFGHSLHAQSIIPGAGAFDGAMSEGAGDFLSASITGDPAMGRGFLLTDAPLRHIDPEGTEAVFPADLTDDVHVSGLIYAGAFWDLRKTLIASLGEAAGIETTERLFYATLQRASDMPSSYIEVLLEDDDDGDLANGTPNYCDIYAAFSTHGLNQGEPYIGTPAIDGASVSVPVLPPIADCSKTATAVTLEWRPRAEPGAGGSVPMPLANGAFTAEIPFTTQGQVVQYRIAVTFSDGSMQSLPDNPADPWYERFIGTVTPLYCTSFESNPALEGWTHAGPGDDWQWGAALGLGTDPDAAHAGDSVFGTDLGIPGDGSYGTNILSNASSPIVAAGGHDSVRLQYRRWLNVEDGFFDRARIYANDTLVWSNVDSNQGNASSLHHRDREWRFHDVDLTATLANGIVQVRFQLESDLGLQFGGWTLDDFCIVAYDLPDAIFASGFEPDAPL